MEEIVKEFKDLELAVKQRDDKIQELRGLIKTLKRTLDYSNKAAGTAELGRTEASRQLTDLMKDLSLILQINKNLL